MHSGDRELVALNVADLEENEDGLKIIIRKSKADQEGHCETIAIVRGGASCPVKAVNAWLLASGISEGPVFRPVAKGGRLATTRLTAKSVCEIVKVYAERTSAPPQEFCRRPYRPGPPVVIPPGTAPGFP